MKLAAAIIALLVATTATAVESHRSITPSSWSYVQADQPIDISFSTSLNVVDYENYVLATLSVDASTEFDLYVEHSIYSRDVINQLLRNDVGRGEPFSDIWGWTMSRRFDGTYAYSYDIEVPFYFTNGKESFLALGDVVAKFRFMVRYMDGSQLVQGGWYKTDTVEYDAPEDALPPQFVSVGSLSALNFSFGPARSVVLVANLQCEDQPAGYNYSYITRARSQLTGTSHYSDASTSFSVLGRGTCTTGAGLISSTLAAKFTKTIQELVADGDYLFDCEIVLWDAHENMSDWQSIGTLDLRDFD